MDSISTIADCIVCGQAITSPTAYCSDRCEAGEQNVQILNQTVKTWKISEDRRIFFYDQSFGDIADRYIICLLRKLHTVGFREQRELDFVLQKLEKSLLTKINKYNFDTMTRTDINKLMTDLWRANARLWRLRDRCHDSRIPEPDRVWAAFDYIQAGEPRDAARLQLNLIVDGRSGSFTGRIYAHKKK